MIMDEVRDQLFKQVDSYYGNFDGSYREFVDLTSEFLKKSVQLMNQ